jgi:hypothetical protein
MDKVLGLGFVQNKIFGMVHWWVLGHLGQGFSLAWGLP